MIQKQKASVLVCEYKFPDMTDARQNTHHAVELIFDQTLMMLGIDSVEEDQSMVSHTHMSVDGSDTGNESREVQPVTAHESHAYNMVKITTTEELRSKVR